MKNLFLIFTLLLVLSIKGSGQNNLHKSYSKIRSTNILAKDYKLVEAQNAYELALNLSALNHKTTGNDYQYLFFPVVLIENKPAPNDSLKNISMDQIAGYSFDWGMKAGIYGTKGAFHGVLKIEIGSTPLLNRPKQKEK